MSTGEVWDRKGFIKRPGLVKVKFLNQLIMDTKNLSL